MKTITENETQQGQALSFKDGSVRKKALVLRAACSAVLAAAKEQYEDYNWLFSEKK